MRLFGLICMSMLIAVPVNAQTIYKCTDAKGRFVFSHTPCPEQVMGDEQQHSLWRELRAGIVEAMDLLDSLGPDLDSIKQCQANVGALQEKIQALEPRVAEVASTHENLFLAWEQLNFCAVCRPGGVNACRKADSYLSRATNRLRGD